MTDAFSGHEQPHAIESMDDFGSRMSVASSLAQSGPLSPGGSLKPTKVHFSSAKRNTEFHEFFSSVIPSNEPLLFSMCSVRFSRSALTALPGFGCAIQKDILVHGRLYLTAKNIAFKATLFGWSTEVALYF